LNLRRFDELQERIVKGEVLSFEEMSERYLPTQTCGASSLDITQIATAAASVGAFVWNDISSKDSAIIMTLPPGAYTAEVSGQSCDSGIALVEVYDETTDNVP
jgi:hypothetical protein